MEKNIKKNVCICITESLRCTAEINTTLSINYTLIKKNISSFLESTDVQMWSEMTLVCTTQKYSTWGGRIPGSGPGSLRLKDKEAGCPSPCALVAPCAVW